MAPGLDSQGGPALPLAAATVAWRSVLPGRKVRTCGRGRRGHRPPGGPGGSGAASSAGGGRLPPGALPTGCKGWNGAGWLRLMNSPRIHCLRDAKLTLETTVHSQETGSCVDLAPYELSGLGQALFLSGPLLPYLEMEGELHQWFSNWVLWDPVDASTLNSRPPPQDSQWDLSLNSTLHLFASSCDCK